MVWKASRGSLTSHYQSVLFPTTWLWGTLWGGRETLSHNSLSLFLPPNSFSSPILYHTQAHTHTHRHLWLQWLPSGEMKSYFCFQITDCQSNKWICSHQRCEIDVLFSNFNLFSLWRLLSSGAATHTIVFLNIVRNQAVRRCCSLSKRGFIFHLWLPLLEDVVKSHSDEHLLRVYSMCMTSCGALGHPLLHQLRCYVVSLHIFF